MKWFQSIEKKGREINEDDETRVTFSAGRHRLIRYESLADKRNSRSGLCQHHYAE